MAVTAGIGSCPAEETDDLTAAPEADLVTAEGPAARITGTLPPHRKIEAFADGRFSLAKDDVVVFTGSENTVLEQGTAALESRLAVRWRAAAPRFRHMGWEGDTVFRQNRMMEWGSWPDNLEAAGATVVILWFGQVETMDAARSVADFSNSYGRLLDEFSKRTPRLVIIGPPPFEKPADPRVRDNTGLNTRVEEFNSAARKLAAERGLMFVDLFGPLTAMNGARLTRDGLHFTEQGLGIVGEMVARALGAEAVVTEDLRRAIIEKNRLWFDTWRCANWAFAFGDRATQPFAGAAADRPPFVEELKRFQPLLTRADAAVHALALGRSAPVPLPAGPPLADPPALSPAEQMSRFALREGFEVNLFADESLGVVRPLQIRWDERGRLWVACSTSYPQLQPGEHGHDFILMLEDSDGDGRADRSLRFADGLTMPMGFEFAIRHSTPAIIPTLHPLPLSTGMASSRGKSMEPEFLGSSHLPDDLRGVLLKSTYYTSQVQLYRLRDVGSGFASEDLGDLMSGGNEFRPVETRVGPDGAIYVCDWLNPVIGHYQASYRDPRRDRSHGRIWRVTAKGRPLVEKPSLGEMTAEQLVGRLASPERWERDAAKFALFRKTAGEVLPVVEAALKSDRKGDRMRFLYELSGVLAAHETASQMIIDRLMASEDFRDRAWAARLVGVWAEKLEDPLGLLENLLAVLIEYGGPEDADFAISEAADSPAVMEALVAKAWRVPDADYGGQLRQLLASPHRTAHIAACRIVAASGKDWGSAERIGGLLDDPAAPSAVRAAALAAVVKLRGREVLAEVLAFTVSADPQLRAAAFEAGAPLDPAGVAVRATEVLAKASSGAEIGPVLAPLLGLPDGPSILAKAITDAKLSADAAKLALRWMAETGRDDAPVRNALNTTAGIVSAVPDYSAALVKRLVAEASSRGDAARGSAVFAAPQAACAACHKVGNEGGALGPDLGSIGRAMMPEVIVEAVLWPKRQVKEGFMLTRITTRDGRTWQGYVAEESAQAITLRDSAGHPVGPISKTDIAIRGDSGSLMPEGLTAWMSEQQRLDLLRYLFEQGK